MEPTDDGGPAFARPAMSNDREGWMNDAQEGMALRDYFAAAALARVGDPAAGPKAVARAAYRLADAMLAARTT